MQPRHAQQQHPAAAAASAFRAKIKVGLERKEGKYIPIPPNGDRNGTIVGEFEVCKI